MRFDHPRGLRQSMSWLHTWSGLVLGWLLFAIYVTGTLAFFRNEITFWMQPELHKADSRTLALDRALQTLEQKAADATQWTLTLPSPRNPTLGLSWQSTAGRGEDQPEGARPEGRNREGAASDRAREGGGRAREERAERTASNEPATTPRERPAGREGRPEGARPEGARPEGRGTEGATFDRTREGGGQTRGERPERTANGEQGTTPRERPAGRESRPEGARPEGARPEGARPRSRDTEGATSDRTREGGGQVRGERAERTTNGEQGTTPRERPAGYESRPEGARPEGTRPEGTRPEGTRPEGTRPEGTRPEGTRPEGTSPEGERPGGARLEGTEGATFDRAREGNWQTWGARIERTAYNEEEAVTPRERPAGREGRPEGARPEGARPEGRNREGAASERAREGDGQAREERVERTSNGEQTAAMPRERSAGREGRPEGIRPEGARPEGRNREGAASERVREGGELAREEHNDRGERMANDERAAQGGQSAQRQQGGGGGGGGGGRGPRILLDPATGEVLQGRTTAGGNFLYRFHFELYGMDRTWARWIVGIATLLMFAALISGVIVHRNIFKDFFTFRPAKGKRSWLDAHNASSVMSLPFHIVITFSGLLLFGNMMIPTAMQSVYHDRDAYMQDMRGRMMMTTPTQPSGERAPLTDLGPLLAVAEQTWQNRGIGSITITNPGDRNAIVDIRQAMAGGSLAAGRNMADSLRFDGVSGTQLDSPAVVPVSAVQSISNTLIMLHRGFFASPVARWLLFLAGVGGSIMIATGLVMWVVARAKDQEKASRAARFGHRLVEVLNVAGVAGLLVAIGAYFWASRLIPADLPDRNTLEIQVFFYGWLIAFIYALIRRHKAAWIEELTCAGLLIALLPFVNALTGGLSLFGSIYLDQWIVAGFDLCALAIGIGLLFAARKVYLHTPRVRPEKTTPGTEGNPSGKGPNAASEVTDGHGDEEASSSDLSFNNPLQAGENA